MNEQESKIFKVQRIRFCNIFDLPHDHPFDKDFLISIANANLADTIMYNDMTVQVTFAMKHLAREILRVEHHTYTK